MTLADAPVFSVAKINGLVRELLEGEFRDVVVSGELSNVRVHGSGHVYFRLKDAAAQLSAVCFRGDARSIDFKLEDGVQVLARGRLTVYEAQGSYQLIARTLEPAGRGDLERAYRLLLAKLQAEGLFDEARKRPLPRYPATVAVVTSPTGAAIRDILSTLRRRFPCVDVLVAPVLVQGEQAPPQIVQALDAISAQRAADVIIVGRGGGSIEDLWAFNDEEVARAIHRCAIPVISAVGHESDVTIADLVADRRAATPTMAAEVAVPDRADVLRRLTALEDTMAARARSRVQMAQARVAELLRSYALGSVRGRIEQGMQSVDFASLRLAQAVRTRTRDAGARLDTIVARLGPLDPRAVMRRGFSVCMDPASGLAIRSAAEAVAARAVHLAFADGTVAADVRELSSVEETS
ncbi:MAG TPA: exodeoxyribonuclease VII large subunit [Candidatus Krumholzibacteria bacterium]|nr:exodeoxyribonuclease VII large subunit [Candidatus Krumholzibacteria bacterium]